MTEERALRTFLQGLEAAARPKKHSGMGGHASSGSRAFGRPASWAEGIAARDFARDVADIWNTPLVALGMQWIYQHLGRPRFWIREADTETELDDHRTDALRRILERPNPFTTRKNLLWSYILHRLATKNGEAFIRKERARARDLAPRGNVVELWSMPYPEAPRPEWPEDGSTFISHYSRVVDGRRIELKIDDVIHSRVGSNPLDQRAGCGVLWQSVASIAGDARADLYTASVLGKMGAIPVAVYPDEPDATFDDSDIADLEKSYLTKTTGANTGMPWFLTAKVGIKELALSPEKMALDKIRRSPEARVLAGMGLNLPALGLVVADQIRSYSNLAVYKRMAYEAGVQPHLDDFAEDARWQLLPDFGLDPERYACGWDYARVPAMREDETARSARSIAEFTANLATRDEARVEIGYEPIDNAPVWAADVSAAQALAVAEATTDPDDDPDDKGGRPTVEEQERKKESGETDDEA